MSRALLRGLVLGSVAFAVHTALAQAPGAEEAELELLEEVEEGDVATPGGLVVLEEVEVVGDRVVDIQQAVTEVISVLSAEDISRTGEGDIAGALSFVPGLSVVGGGFVYVRGLGDRYSLALLNGSPLPSPEPLRRAVPLDLFPTDVIASSLVQKTYSPNYPGEFGGGVINLTTLAIPKTPFLKIGAGLSGNTETTGKFGYDYYGSSLDWTGYDNGNRDTPPALQSFYASGERMSALDPAESGAVAKQFINWHNGLVQRIDRVAPNYSASFTGGTSWSVGNGELGLVATGGFSNDWRTRDNIEQNSASFDLSSVDKDYHQVSSENRVVTNALFGLGYQSGRNQLRWTNLYIHDTLKRASLSEGLQRVSREGWDFLDQSTGWYERELLSSQLAGSLDFDPLRLNARASWSTSKRDAPYEFGIGYIRTNVPGQPFGPYFVNRLDNTTGYAEVAFSDLDEDLISAGLDANLRVAPGVVLSAGYDYAYTSRDSSRREFQIIAPSEFPTEVGLFRPDFLLGSAIIDLWGLRLIETTEQFPAFAARMLTHGAFGQVQAQLAPSLELSAGARFERGKQVVRPIQVFNSGTSSNAFTRLEEDYVLPAGTLTWKFGETREKQVRLSASQTIARPQFRELMFQSYYDPEANRTYRGNPLLTDSKFFNAEGRYEWYFSTDQRFSLAAFYKKIDRPIEAFTGFNDNVPITSYANAPRATLKGAEIELQKYFDLSSLGEQDGGLLNTFMSNRRLVLIGNYTYTQSSIGVGENDIVEVFGTSAQPATNYFIDGSQLTGQSDHLVNLQVGVEHPRRLSQVTLLLSYASDRVTSRGAAGLPDIFESPGMKVDFVVRQGFTLFNQSLDFKAEVRNIFGRGYSEYQQSGANIIYFNKYDIGTKYGLSISANF